MGHQAVGLGDPGGDVVGVAGPANLSEVRHPARQGHVPRVAPAVDQPRLGEQRGDQAEIEGVLGHLVDHPIGVGIDRREAVEISVGQSFEPRSVEPLEAIGEGSGRPGDFGDRLECLAGESQLAGAEHPGMAGEDLLDQRCPRPGQAEDEHGRSLVRPQPRTRSKKLVGNDWINWSTNPGMPRGLIAPPAVLELRSLEGVGLGRERGGPVELRSVIEHLGQAEEQGRGVAPGRVRSASSRSMAACSLSGSLPRSRVASLASTPACRGRAGAPRGSVASA